MRRKGMNKKILEKIIKTQLGDKVKKRKADFVIQTSTSKRNSYNQTLSIIKTIIDNNTFSGLTAKAKLSAWKRI